LLKTNAYIELRVFGCFSSVFSQFFVRFSRETLTVRWELRDGYSRIGICRNKIAFLPAEEKEEAERFKRLFKNNKSTEPTERKN